MKGACPVCGQKDIGNLGPHFRWSHNIRFRDWILNKLPPCESCGGRIVPKPNSRHSVEYLLGRRFCSLRCQGRYFSGKHHPQYKRGWITPDGYRKLGVNGKDAFEHRLVMEQTIGRKLHTHEHVHHINGDKLDNRSKNLVIMSAADHTTFHRKGTDVGIN